MIRTQVGIVGAGPAGLMLGHILGRSGIDSVIVESRSAEHVVERVRAGVLEQGTVDLMHEQGLGARLTLDGMRHDGVSIAFDGRRHRIDLADLTGGRAITIYGQNEIVKDLIAARVGTGRPLLFGVSDVEVDGLDSREPHLRFCRAHDACDMTRDTARDVTDTIACDFIVGCDGSHGICRPTVPPGALRTFERQYPFGWLGVLASAAPSTPELVYSRHERGFALFSMRSPTITRLYLQCAPDEDLSLWPDERVWTELQARLRTVDGWQPTEGPILQKSVTTMRGVVVEPMRCGRLFLAGDAAHIVPPTGAKGLNLAMADVGRLARALVDFYRSGREVLLDDYSDAGVRQAWRAQRFSAWMTSTLHRCGGDDGFDDRRQIAELEYLVSSRAAMTSFAENYVG